MCQGWGSRRQLVEQQISEAQQQELRGAARLGSDIAGMRMVHVWTRLIQLDWAAHVAAALACTRHADGFGRVLVTAGKAASILVQGLTV